MSTVTCTCACSKFNSSYFVHPSLIVNFPPLSLQFVRANRVKILIHGTIFVYTVSFSLHVKNLFLYRCIHLLLYGTLTAYCVTVSYALHTTVVMLCIMIVLLQYRITLMYTVRGRRVENLGRNSAIYNYTRILPTVHFLS